jgi:parallel beta-helix repeat protein
MKKTVILMMLSGSICGGVSAADVNADLSKYRELPLRELATVKTLFAADFGAVPNDGKNDCDAIQRALDELAKQTQPAKLVIAPGRYLLDKPDIQPGESGYFLFLNQSTNAVVEFSGAELIAKNPSRGFLRIENCENVIFQNATVDYDPVPHTEGIIRAVHPDLGAIDLEIREGFPSPDQDCFNNAPSRWGGQMDPKIPGRLKTGAVNFHFYSTVEKLDNGLFRIGLNISSESTWDTLELGDRFCVLARGSNSFFHVRHSRQITALNLTSCNVPGGHYVSVMAEAFNVLGCKSPIKPGFWKGGNADAVHCQSNRIGPWIEDCLFEGISDDSLVIYARPFSVVEQLSPTRLQISRLSNQNKAMPLYEGELVVGDVLDFLNPETGIVLATARVTSYDKAEQVIELDAPVAGLEPGIDRQKTQIWNRAMGSGFVMKNNVLRNSRRYGIYLKASNGLIEGNTLEGLSSCAMTLHNEPRAPNGPFCHNVTIRNNTITECGFEEGFLKYEEIGALRVTSRRYDYLDAQSGTAHSNIRIENNRFSKLQRNPVFLSNVDGAVLDNNTLDGAPVDSKNVIVQSCSGVEFE